MSKKYNVQFDEDIRFNVKFTEGIRGASAYEVALQNGFSGTEEEWLASLKAETDKEEIAELAGEAIKEYLIENPISQVQADWNQTDETAVDYIKNKPALLKGDKGDPFTYEDFTEEQLASLKGEDGNTPVKGTDYWTEADRAEIVEEVLGQTGGGGASGSGTVESDFEIVADVTLEEDISKFQIDLAKQCTEIYGVYIPYGSDANTETGNTTPYIYYNYNLWAPIIGQKLAPSSYKSAGYKYAANIFHATISGGIWESNVYDQTSYTPTETQPFKEGNNKISNWNGGIIGNNTKGSEIRTFRDITLQIWGVVFGTGTRIIVWGR